MKYGYPSFENENLEAEHKELVYYALRLLYQLKWSPSDNPHTKEMMDLESCLKRAGHL